MGCGKSHQSRRIFDHLNQHPAMVIYHAFQAEASAKERCPMGIQASILSRLLDPGSKAKAQRSAFADLTVLYSQHKETLGEVSAGSAWTSCANLLKDRGSFILVVDALDGCVFGQDTVSEAEKLMQGLHSLLAATNGKAIIFSRPGIEYDIAIAFDSRRYEIHMTPEDTRAEHDEFCERLSANLHNLPDELRLRVTEKAKASFEGSFLWTRLLFEDMRTKCGVKDFEKSFREFPSTCLDYYCKEWRTQMESLDPISKDYCRGILLAILGAQRQLSKEEITGALEIFPNSAPRVLSQFCRPLVVVEDGFLHLVHPIVRDLLGSDKSVQSHGVSLAKDEPDVELAWRCLECLMNGKYAELDRIGRRLRKNFASSGLTEDGVGFTDEPCDSFYDYAAKYWDVHLSRVLSPGSSLIDLVAKFLGSLQFSHWAEYSYKGGEDLQAVRSANIRLTKWSSGLADDTKSRLNLDQFFETPYQKLNQEYSESSRDKVLQWLPLIRLGLFFFDVGKISKMDKIRSTVADGLSDLLGPRHPLALKARSEAAYASLYGGDIPRARQTYIEVAEDQRAVDPDSKQGDLFFTLVYQGLAEHLLNSNRMALETLSAALNGFMNTAGPESNGYLIAQLRCAQVDASAGHVRQSVEQMEHIRRVRERQHGVDDSFAVTTRIYSGNLYRILGEQESALDNLEHALKFRRQFKPISFLVTAEPAIILAIAYRDFGKNVEAENLVDELLRDADLEDKDRFVLLCQVTHMKSLLLFDRAEVDEAIELLRALLIRTDREQENRPLLWARLDLAVMLRYRDCEGDEGAANSIFQGIVAEVGRGDPGGDEPDTPRVLKLAEMAVQLFRNDSLEEASAFLRSEELWWVREADLWLHLGAPAADTREMKPPRELGDESPSEVGWAHIPS
ncbi:hypothetical protein QQS21_004365 [Conoideocrella luteorostrata]|uniref:Nephrocystin 3-like N-terminal domain-containing protein n=1 Tax=Conoideocrella luteorostrata TaxID=1105319 RepID=A0AAJ0FVH9_9HYPO|nr:hypothetical protein QQS21_004365 [Conoideocrella luteorostrata]